MHFLVLSDGAPIGTARLLPNFDSQQSLGKLGRFAVLKEHRQVCMPVHTHVCGVAVLCGTSVLRDCCLCFAAEAEQAASILLQCVKSLTQSPMLPHTIHRGKGVGRELADAAEGFARDELQLKGLVLHAQLSAAPFYSRLGFTVLGPTFLEENIPHVMMRKLF